MADVDGNIPMPICDWEQEPVWLTAPSHVVLAVLYLRLPGAVLLGASKMNGFSHLLRK